jgi:hypothetical protein
MLMTIKVTMGKETDQFSPHEYLSPIISNKKDMGFCGQTISVIIRECVAAMLGRVNSEG